MHSVDRDEQHVLDLVLVIMAPVRPVIAVQCVIEQAI